MSVRLLIGDCRDVLKTLPDESVHCVVTSPPYFGLRDYGTAKWEGGDPDCSHAPRRGHGDEKQASSAGTSRDPIRGGPCHCGARRIDSQIGLEPTPDAYVAEMVAVFREVRRVLRKDGTCFLNLGDSYAGSNTTGGTNSIQGTAKRMGAMFTSHPKLPSGLKPKDLIGIPWRVAFALQADGWWLRQDIIWAKPNPMPESVTDRCTKAHEYLFLRLTRSATYWYDAEAIAEAGVGRETYFGSDRYSNGSGRHDGGSYNDDAAVTRNKRSVWTVPSQPFPNSHFATFPPALIEPCIKAGCPEKACVRCGAPWRRDLTESTGGKRSWHDHSDDIGAGQSQSKHGQQAWDTYTPRQTLGFSPSCACDSTTVPGVCLDPFGGAGTTGLVADRLGRNAILIELNPSYAEMGKNRIVADGPLFAQLEMAL